MKLTLTNKQKGILRGLRLKDAGENGLAFDNLEKGAVTFAEIDILCNLINDEFMMKGILPTYEPNEYGMELESLLDLINWPRLNGPQ